MKRRWTCPIAVLAALAATWPAAADTVEMADGTILNNVYVRDEGIRYLVWNSLAEVGGPSRAIPRSQVKKVTIERGDAWDRKPALPDLSVTFIEMTPKLAGLHGRVNYDKYGRPTLGGGSLPDLGERAAWQPEEVVKNLKLAYEPGEEITLTARVKNVGFATAKPFDVVWLIDGCEVKRDRTSKSLKEMEQVSFPLKWKWEEGRHTATFRIVTAQPEIATINNEIEDPLWGWSYYYIVSPGRLRAWHENRSAYGTFSFEDFYRWHVDIMNALFAASKYPAAPNGIEARVRLDRIIVADDPEAAQRALVADDGIGYHQGGWVWLDDEDRNKQWKPPTHEWRNQTEWSLPHELGHQLGLVDYYVLDCEGVDAHTWPDNGAKVTHFQNHPNTMMHWHGPQTYAEIDAAYFNMRWNKPGGYFGDYYFAIPKQNFLRVTDVNGRALPNARVEIFQRGVAVEENGAPVVVGNVSYYPVLEDGNFDRPVSTRPVIVGMTDADGMMPLPNRPAEPVRTLNGFERGPNPFGNINVVGQRGEMLVKVTRGGAPAYFWLELPDFAIAWFRGHKDSYTTVLKTPFASVDSPLPPRNVRAERLDEDRVKVTWDAPEVVNETQYLEKAIGFQVFRRVGDMGLNDRPWFAVAATAPGTREVIVDLNDKPNDTEWFTRTDRFAVASVGELGVLSGLESVVLE